MMAAARSDWRVSWLAPGARSMILALSAALICLTALRSAHAAPPSAPIAAEQGAPWGELKPAQQTALRPLQQNWSGIDAPSKRKWLELSARFPTMSPEERARVQGRMADWSRLTPQQRGQARARFQESTQLPKSDRQARWEAYQALTPEQKDQLAARSAESSRRAPPPRNERPGRGDLPQAKSNIVPNPAFGVPPRAVAPSVLQAQPGATTSVMSRRAAPPAHQQTGLPKIAATPEFVNKATLLPQRGPQGAATRGEAASGADTRQRR